jgi:O-methyltransferase involved in polyketide biosynthesis
LDPANCGLSRFVSTTALIVAAGRLAEAKRSDAILVDPLLEALIGNEEVVKGAIKKFETDAKGQEKEDGVDHVASFTSVRMRYGDEQLLSSIRTAPEFQVPCDCSLVSPIFPLLHITTFF